MKKFSLALLGVAAALAITPAAMADTFNFTFKVGGITATGTLTGTEIGNTGLWNITSGTIDLTGASINGSGILLANTNGNGDGTTTYRGGYANLQYDDLLSPTGSAPAIGGNSGGDQLDGWGLFFLIGNAGVDIWGNGPNNYSIFEGNQDPHVYSESDGGSFITPEPSSLVLLGTGLIGLALLAFRKVRSSGQAPWSLGS